MMQATVDFTALYEAHHRIVWAFCYHLTRNPEDADDLAQDTWLRAIRANVASDNPHAWLCAIAHNLARDRWRQHCKRERRLPTAEAGRNARLFVGQKRTRNFKVLTPFWAILGA